MGNKMYKVDKLVLSGVIKEGWKKEAALHLDMKDGQDNGERKQ